MKEILKEENTLEAAREASLRPAICSGIKTSDNTVPTKTLEWGPGKPDLDKVIDMLDDLYAQGWKPLTGFERNKDTGRFRASLYFPNAKGDSQSPAKNL